MDVTKAQIIRDIQHTFNTEHGARSLAYLEKFCLSEMKQSPFDPTSERQTSYNLGAQSVYRHIKYLMSINPDSKTEDVITEPETDQ